MESQRRTLFVLFLVVFMDMLGFSILFPLFPKTLLYFQNQSPDFLFTLFYQIAESISWEKGDTFTIVLFGGILGSLYSFLQFLFAPIWGKLSDHRGRRSILIFTTLGNTFGYLLWFFSSSFTVFVLSRVVTGIMGGNLSVASATMADVTEEKNRAAGMGLLGAGIGLGFVMGPLLGGISSAWNFLPVEIFQIPLVVFASSAFFSVIASLFTFVLVVFTIPKTTLTRKTTTREFHPFLGLLDPNLKKVLPLVVLYFLFILGFSGFEFTLNFFLAEEFQFSPKQIGFTFLYIGVIIILVQGGLLRRLVRRIPEFTISKWGAVSAAIGMYVLVAIGNEFLGLLTALFFLALGSALVNPSLSSLVSFLGPKEEMGKTLGLFRSFGSLGRAVSPLLFSFVYFQKDAFVSFYLSLVLLFLFLVYLIRLPIPESQRTHVL